jgi:hypothetical protein
VRINNGASEHTVNSSSNAANQFTASAFLMLALLLVLEFCNVCSRTREHIQYCYADNNRALSCNCHTIEETNTLHMVCQNFQLFLATVIEPGGSACFQHK